MYGPKWPFLLILIVYGPSVVFVNCWDRFCTLGRAPRTKETLSNFREWCQVTRHPRVFRRLTGCQRTPENWGVTVFSFGNRNFGPRLGSLTPKHNFSDDTAGLLHPNSRLFT